MTLIDLCKVAAIQHGDSTMYHLWDDILLDTRVDKDTLLLAIFDATMGEDVLYNDTAAFKMFSDNWFKRNYNVIKELLDTQEYEYNPIENYDRVTEGNKNDVSTYDEGNYSEGKYDVSAFNQASSYSPQSHTSDNGGRNSVSDGEQRYRETVHGNIGVRSSQELIEQQRQLVQFNIYTWIVKRYRDSFFSQVY